jgi:metallopeptidase MepB
MHDLLSRTQYSHFHSYECVADFIEAPSQLLENFCWLLAQLKSISRHYSYLSPEYKELWQRRNPSSFQPPERISVELINSIVDARHVNEALMMLRQVGLSDFDMKIHGQLTDDELTSLSVGGIYNDCRKKYGLIDGPEALGEPAD